VHGEDVFHVCGGPQREQHESRPRRSLSPQVEELGPYSRSACACTFAGRYRIYIQPQQPKHGQQHARAGPGNNRFCGSAASGGSLTHVVRLLLATGAPTVASGLVRFARRDSCRAEQSPSFVGQNSEPHTFYPVALIGFSSEPKEIVSSRCSRRLTFERKNRHDGRSASAAAGRALFGDRRTAEQPCRCQARSLGCRAICTAREKRRTRTGRPRSAIDNG
jgi:hypothetical protein